MPRRFSKPLHSTALARLHIKPPIAAAEPDSNTAIYHQLEAGALPSELSADLYDSAAISRCFATTTLARI